MRGLVAAGGAAANVVQRHYDFLQSAKASRLRFTMIYPYTNDTQTRWDHGDFKVQLSLPNNSRPMGYCDGTDADISELRALAESEGADEMRIEKKALKTGREVWTLIGGG